MGGIRIISKLQKHRASRASNPELCLFRAGQQGRPAKRRAYNGALGIILCDGGSDFLPRSRNIIHEFFRDYPYINFVLAFRVEQNFGLGASNQVIVYFEKGPGLSTPSWRNFFRPYTPIICSRIQCERTRNARYALKSKKPLRLGSFYGGCTMQME